MSELTTFQFPDTGAGIRSLAVDGDPYFVVADVCRALDLTNPSMAAARLDSDDLSTAEVIDGLGRSQQTRIASESGLYNLIFQSRKPEAKAFKRWVTHEVLPAIRRTGRYDATPALPNARQLAELVIAEADRADKAETALAIAGPKAETYDVLATADDGELLIADAAKALSNDPLIDIGRNRMFELLNSWHWVYRQGSDNKWRAMQTAIIRGWLTERITSYTNPRTDETAVSVQVRITVKGIAAVRKRLTQTPVLAA